MVLLSFIIISWFDWRVLKTDNFIIIYKPGYEYEASQTLKNLEYYRNDVVKLTGNYPRQLPIVIEDIGILSNGYADPFFYNIHIFTNPPNFDYYLEGTEDWFRNVSVHEFTHIAHLTKTSGLPKLLTGAFGSLFQPNMYSPGWIIEGITVYSESQISPYEGRLNDGFFDNYLGLRASKNKCPTIVEVTNEPLSFPYGGIYLYGGEFFDFLSDKYGQDRFARFFNIYGSYPWAPFSALLPILGPDLAALSTYSRTFPTLFSEWHRYLKSKTVAENYDATRLTKDGWYISSLVNYRDKIYYVREKPIKINGFTYEVLVQLMEYDLQKKKERVFATINSWLTAKMRLYNNNLYFCSAEIKRAKNAYLNGFGITSVLKRINLETKKSENLLKDDIRTFCVLNDSTILYAKNKQTGYGSEICLYNKSGKKKLQESEMLINDIETNGKWIVVSAKKQFENTDLYTFDMDGGSFNPIITTPWTEGNLYFIGEDLLGFIANYDGKHYAYAVNLNNPEQILRYTEEGFTNAFVVLDNTLIFSGLNIDGFDIYETKCKPELYYIKDYEYTQKPDFNSLNMQTKNGNYFDIAKTLYPSVRLPIFLPVDSTFKKWLYSAVIAGFEATGEHSYLTWIGYDQLNDEPLLMTTIQSYFFSPLSVGLFYNLGNSFSIMSYYPLYRSLGYGISNVTFGLSFNSFDDFIRKEIIPRFSLTARLPYSTYFGDLSIPLERIGFNSSINRTCFNGVLGFNKIMFGGELRTYINGFYDPQNPDTPSVSIRGYNSVNVPEGTIFTAEYSHTLFKLRKGFWNPNIYFEDLFGIIFFDYAIFPEKDNYYSFGIELSLETKMCFNFLQFLPRIGVAINGDKEIKAILDVKTSTALFHP
ncbi:MAG: hypothetical protein ABIL69_09080 [candidate division WOR-3 bacterium]